MNKVLKGLPNVFCYVDDILIFSKTYSEHLLHLTAVFDRLLTNELVLNQYKCLFAQSELDFLGYHVTSSGISQKKIDILSSFPKPTSEKQMKKFFKHVKLLRKASTKY